ncbi:hypothetical protein Ga0080559_TMP5153 (plasmid) [Salipiger profundus]|uniref:Uncharacterized protein n=1 Tax=Salipiger profundus TaxID=1229727 RepID=A0A1U7DDP9_9RHOB|nr:hypothetical protein Ga0080559_TMP5153 [Salipiger profundus]
MGRRKKYSLGRVCTSREKAGQGAWAKGQGPSRGPPAAMRKGGRSRPPEVLRRSRSRRW